MNNFQKKLIEFSEGEWVRETPTEPGDYHVRTRDGYYAGVRTLAYLGNTNKLVDTRNIEHVEGRVTTWKGFWWSKPIPEMPPLKKGK